LRAASSAEPAVPNNLVDFHDQKQVTIRHKHRCGCGTVSAPTAYFDQMIAEPVQPFTLSPGGAAVYQLGPFGKG